MSAVIGRFVRFALADRAKDPRPIFYQPRYNAHFSRTAKAGSSVKPAKFTKFDRERTPPPSHLDEVLSAEKRQLSVDEWQDLFESTTGERWGKVTVNETNFPGIAMRVCAKTGNYPAAKSLIQYMEHRDSEKSSSAPRIGVYSTFMRICGLSKDYDVEKDVLRAFEKIPKEMYDFDSSVTLGAVIGLTATSRWKDAVSLTEKLEQKDLTSGSSARALLARRAFEIGETEEGWKHLDKFDPLFGMHGVISSPAIAYLNKTLNLRNKVVAKSSQEVSLGLENESMAKLRRLLDWLAGKELTVNEELGQTLVARFQNDPHVSWSVGETRIDAGTGQCSGCDRRLPLASLSEEEFLELRSSFMDRALTGRDVYLKSTPDEVAKFRKFVAETAPYDLVIDGLNVMYTAGRERTSDGIKKLAAVVKHFALEKGKSVAVLGRRHMTKNFDKNIRFIRDHSRFFTLESLSMDDLFIVYAAMFSGQDCFLLSRDMMKNHGAKLQDERLRKLYLKWLRSRRITLIDVLPNGKALTQPPCVHVTTVVETDPHCWHIPVQRTKNDPEAWFCVHPRDQSNSRQK